MDDVPVKIVERYKPPPLVYQLPQSIANKLAQEPGYYNEQPQFQYDFQLERNVLTQVHCWRQVRQREREARQERIERRKLERQRAIEAQQKEMLGAVQYPSAAELSSSTDDDDEEQEEADDPRQSDADDSGANNSSCEGDESRATAATQQQQIAITTKSDNLDKKSINSSQSSNFHNILQPTVLSQCNTANASVIGVGIGTGVGVGVGVTGDTTKESYKKHKRLPSLNYSDFEYDNSSPFDNIELKTINDLDILAQVLHNTQLNNTKQEQQTQQQEQQIVTSEAQVTAATNLDELKETKAALEKIDFNTLNQCDADNIPNHNNTNTNTNNINTADSNLQQTHIIGNNFNVYHHTYSPTTTATTPANNTQPYIQHHQIYQNLQTHTPTATSINAYSQYYQQPQTALYTSNSVFSNHNYLMAPYCNGHQHQQQQQQQQEQLQYMQQPHGQQQLMYYATEVDDTASKSKSVPDILRELKTEVNNSEMRRARNLSYNLDNDNATEIQQEKQPKIPNPIYNELAAPARKLAQRISSMGFPLERVAKVVNICGVDDKKIIEHLIPLSELMDLGFEESKISAALLKFDNNKDKALDYLIS